MAVSPARDTTPQCGAHSLPDTASLERLAISAGALSVWPLCRIVLSFPASSALVAIDLCNLALAWRLTRIAQLGLLSATAFQVSVGLVTALVFLAGSVRLSATADPMETAGLAGLLAVSQSLLNKPSVYVGLAAVAGPAWAASPGASRRRLSCCRARLC